jgi:hypothetical protein
MLLVFGAVIFAVYGWSIRGFFYKLPSFMLYFGLGANLAILCYMLAFALLESLLVTSLLVLVSVILPSRWLKAGFAYKAFLVILVATIAMILFEGYYRAAFLKDILAGQTYPFPPFILGMAGSILALAALLWLFHWKPRLQAYALDVAERMSLFTYIYVPLGIIGLVVVLARNLR